MKSGWIKVLASDKPYVAKVREQEEEIRRSIQKLQMIEQETSLSVERIKRHQPSYVNR